MNATSEMHRQIFKRYRDLETETLKIIMFDCRQVLKAIPDSPQAEQYKSAIHHCLMELATRRINAYKN
tara:strand:+ start:1531 stop:1734 length:204 start_codon:yes stop_codon:yes gene_type:complete